MDTFRHFFGGVHHGSPGSLPHCLCPIRKSPLIPSWTELDTFRHYFGGVHDGSPGSLPHRLCPIRKSPLIPNWTELDTFRHYFGGVHHGSPTSRRASCVAPTGRPASRTGQNWTLLDTFLGVSTTVAKSPAVPRVSHPQAALHPELDRIGHYFGGVPARLPISPPGQCVPAASHPSFLATMSNLLAGPSRDSCGRGNPRPLTFIRWRHWDSAVFR